MRRRSELRRQAAAEGRNLPEEFKERLRAQFQTGAEEAADIVDANRHTVLLEDAWMGPIETR
ncbi:hypothetical protein [Aeromicrobium sp. 179-A 4D2 NHS]|uniref:hypothetical protein n=1 Tax=Aeromicrobium sp. 179-A 4D2 NHS TaxID=3142375 RepID=UPI00399FD769